MFSLLTTLFFSLYAIAYAAPSLVKRIVVDPPITSPDASTVWTVGSTVTVTWDTSVIHVEAQNSTGSLVLGFQTPDSENLQLDDPLAKGFLLTEGSAQITVPDVTEKSNYIVVLFGDSGNASPEFTITGGSTSSSSASSSVSGASTSTETVIATTATTLTVPSTTSTGTAVVVTASSESSLSTVLSASSTFSESVASGSPSVPVTTTVSTLTAEASSTASAGTAVADTTSAAVLGARSHRLRMPLVVCGVAMVVAFVL